MNTFLRYRCNRTRLCVPTTSKGNPVKSQDAMEKLDKMAQNLGELIDKENELLKGAIKNVGSRLKT